ncbi:MAG: SDR family oxidoreductase [Patescibacteria group bacterium]
MKIKELYSLKDKTAIITGGGGKVGKFIVRGLWEAGAKCIILSRKKANASDLLKEAKLNGYSLSFLACDITKEKDLIKISKKLAKNKNIKILINNAVYTISKNIESLTYQDWQKTYEVNLLGGFLCVKHIGQLIKKNGGGSIINIGSHYGCISCDERIYRNKNIASSLSYATTKSGILNFTRYIATHWAKYKIRCNTISPGGFQDKNNNDYYFRREYKKRVPLGRMAFEDDIKGVAVFLASEASQYITGQNIIVDGGWTAW